MNIVVNSDTITKALGADNTLLVRSIRDGAAFTVRFPTGDNDPGSIKAFKDRTGSNGATISPDQQKVEILLAAVGKLHAAGFNSARLHLTAQIDGKWTSWPHIIVEAAAATSTVVVQQDQGAVKFQAKAETLSALLAQGVLTAEQFASQMQELVKAAPATNPVTTATEPASQPASDEVAI